MEFTKKRIALILAALGAAAGLGLIVLLYVPLVREMKARASESGDLEAQVMAIRSKIAQFKTETKAKPFISESDASVAIDELTQKGKSQEINFVSITPGVVEKKETETFQILPIEMELESGYQRLGTFLGSMQGLEKSLMTVKNFNVISDPEVPSKLNTKVTVNLYVTESSHAK